MIVYTAIYGDYDFLHPHPEIVGVEWRAYTDNPDLDPHGWNVVVEPSRYSHSRLSAKYRKCYPPLDHSRSVWVDGCFQVLDPSFIGRIVNILTPDHPIALWPHPQRTTISSEAHFSASMRKYRGLDMGGQVLRYLERNPEADKLGLWASTVIGRIHRPDVLQFGAAWLANCEWGTYQDQLSLPVMLADHDLVPAKIPGSLLHGNGFAWRWGDHRSHD